MATRLPFFSRFTAASIITNLMNTASAMNSVCFISRRKFLTTGIGSAGAVGAAWAIGNLGHSVFAEQHDGAGQGRGGGNRDRIYGLLVGSAIGDAVGGPVEFKKPIEVKKWLPGCRDWPDDRRLTCEDITQWAGSLPMLSYKMLRPTPEPYGQWQTNAAPGTVTDDTRHKIVLLNALRLARSRKQFPISRKSLAAAYVDFDSSPPIAKRPEYASLCEEGHREFIRAARWVLGERNAKTASPPERLWGGLATCCGQMLLLPLAAIFPGEPDKAYRAAYLLGFVDNGEAKDLNSAVVAGLAQALCTDVTEGQRERAWASVTETMLRTDPYNYDAVPYVQRPTAVWLEFAKQSAIRANKTPKNLFDILETEGDSLYHWEAHFTLAVSFAMLQFCDWNALAAMHLALDFGHDTDSTTQLIGAFAGALRGADIFPTSMRLQVEKRLAADYDQSLQEWADLLETLSDHEQYPVIVDQ